MVVGVYAGVPLQDAADTWRHGAVFLLRNKISRAEVSVSLEGWMTSVVDNVVITRGPAVGSSPEEVFIEALNIANQALDYLSVHGEADCVIRDAHDDHLVWWSDRRLGGVVIRCRAVQSFGISIRATAEVRDIDGNLKPAMPPPTPIVHDVFRFVRMSRTSGDLYDSYRNLFLAFESVLSDLRPRRRIPSTSRRRWWRPFSRVPTNGGTRWEPEGIWFDEALDEAHRVVPLDRLTPPDVTNHKKWIRKHIYSAERSGLMHAKLGEDYYLPHDPSRRDELAESLKVLWDYVIALIGERYHVRRLGSFISAAGVRIGSEGVLSKLEYVISDDDSSPLNRDAENMLAAGAPLIRLQSSAPIVDIEDSDVWWVQSHCSAADARALSAIRRFGHLRGDGSEIADVISEFVGPLVLGDSVVRLEMEHALRHVNPSGPPRRFSS